MNAELRTRILGIGFAATLLVGGAACGGDGDDPGMGGTDEQGEEEDSGVVDGMGGTDDEGPAGEDGMDAGEGMGGTEDDGEG